MKKEIKEAIEQYQCTGCVCGSDISCYEKSHNLECNNHVVGTTISRIGKIYLGMPTGFNRVGECSNNEFNIFENFESSWEYDVFNIPVWKYLNENGHVIVRGISPRINRPFIHIILEDCLDRIDCIEITKKDIEQMD